MKRIRTKEGPEGELDRGNVMSKELEALENIKQDLEYITRLDYVEPIVRGEVRDNLFKIYHRELPELDIIEKALKALEIIKEKKVDTYSFIKNDYQNYNEYLDRMCFLNNCNRESLFKKCCGILTQEEFDVLKEVLKDE